MTFFLGLLKILGGGFSRAWGLLTREIQIPVGLWLLPVLVSFWFWHSANSAHDALEQCKSARAADQKEWAASVAAAKAATAAAQQKGKEAANEAQSLHDQLAASRRSLLDYIAVHRSVRPSAPAAAAPGASDSNAPAIPDVAPAVPTVEVPDTILDGYDRTWQYAQSCYVFGQSLVEKGLVASPQKR